MANCAGNETTSAKQTPMRKLFENLKLYLLESSDLDSNELSELEPVLKFHKVFYEIHPSNEHINKQDFFNKEFTHIVSNNVLFPDYQFTQERFVPVVTTEFLYAIVETGKQQAIRAFSPDPTHVLKKVHLCVGNLPTSDKEAIYGGVRALGGTYNETLNKFVTHVVTTDPDEDCCYAVKSIEGCKIKIVSPSWIHDCLRLRKFVDETPYLLFPDDRQESTEVSRDYDILRKDYETIEPINDILKDKSFYLGTDLELTDRSRRSITSLIENSGGSITTDLRSAKCYIGRYRDGDEYIDSSRKGITVGNLHWIYWMVEHQKWISPITKLLHYPFVRGGHPEMKDFVISSTNYSGDARFYIKQLVESLGATFTSTLTQKNTHLITAVPDGKKYVHALKWDIKIVNHLWLEETYSQWKLMPEKHARYSHYPQTAILDQIVGQTSLDFQVLGSFYGSSSNDEVTHIIEDSEDEKSSPTKISKQKYEAVIDTSMSEKENGVSHENLESTVNETQAPQESLTPSGPQSNPNTDTTPKATPKPSQLQALADISTNSIRPSSGRKAKDKAVAKLHSDMEDLNYFQKQHKSKDVPLLPHEIEEKKRKRESELLIKESKKSVEPEEKVITSGAKPKKAKKSITPATTYSINAIITGWENTFSKSDNQILKNLGIQLHSELNSKVNGIISPKFMRTEKFLTALSYRLDYIISPTFLEQVVESFKSNPTELNRLPKAEDYSLDVVNPKSVRDLTEISLDELMARSREMIDEGEKLFQGTVFNISAKLPGGAAVITKILKAHGAQDVNVIKSVKDLKNQNSIKPSLDGSRVLISTEKEKGLVEKAQSLLKEVPRASIIEWEWVVASIFNMDTTHGTHIVYEN